MQLFWQGYSSIRIESKNGDMVSTLVTDPFENESSIRFPRTVEPDLLVLSHEDRKRFNLAGVSGKPFIVSRPGEYEAKGVFVHGIQDGSVSDQQLVHRITTEGMAIAFLGSMKRKPTNEELEKLENIDILVLPVGGGDVMDAEAAADIVQTIEPRIVVPVHYQIAGLKAKLDGVDAFCKHMGACQREESNRLKIQKKDLPADNILIAVLERA